MGLWGGGFVILQSPAHTLLALRVEDVIHNKLAFKDFAVRQTERTESKRNPTQPDAGWVGFGRARVRSPDDLAEHVKGRIGKQVLSQDRVERYVFPVVAQLTAFDIGGDATTRSARFVQMPNSRRTVMSSLSPKSIHGTIVMA